MKVSQFNNFANVATDEIMGIVGLQTENLQRMFSYPDSEPYSELITIEGDILNIKDASNVNANSCVISIEPKQAGNGIPSPTNKRVITGYNEIVLNHMGKNLFDSSQMVTQLDWNTIRVYIPVGVKIVMSTNQPVNLGLEVYIKNGGDETQYIVYNNHPVTITVSELGYIEVIQRRVSGSELFENYNYQIEIGTTPTKYSEYINSNIDVELPNEQPIICGGNFNVNTGVLTIDRIMLKLGDFTNWAWHASTNSYTASRTSSATFPALKQGNIMCEIAPYVNRQDLPSATIGISISVSGSSIFLKDNVHSGSDDLSDFVASINDINAVFYINSIQTYQLATNDILMYEDNNVIFANCGPVELEYYKKV